MKLEVVFGNFDNLLVTWIQEIVKREARRKGRKVGESREESSKLKFHFTC